MSVSESISIIYLLSDFIAGDLTSFAPFLVLIECLFSRVEMYVSTCVFACTRVCICDKYPPVAF